MSSFQLLHQTRRHYLHKYPFLRSHFHRFLSSSPENPNSTRPESNDPVPIQPVSYNPETPSQESPNWTRPDPDSVGSWTREDLRYLKDAPKIIAPVSYPTRVVAPLPEDRPEGEEEEEGKVEVNEEMERERGRIEAQRRGAIRRVLNVEEERISFPTLIDAKSDEKKKKKKVVYDLKEAIRLVKSNEKKKKKKKEEEVVYDLKEAIWLVKEMIPFPTLIDAKSEENKEVVYDLKEAIRLLKDAPKIIAAISYPTRVVASLPEDRPEGEEEKVEVNEEMEREGARIEAQRRG
ncbi:putative serine/threonine-protein kinase EDR1-like [Capsicum annuum]|nr:putative serine/threonine-protein kinase EDR1-like [Capsicum annuum]